MKSIWHFVLIAGMCLSLYSCGGFQAKRVGSDESDVKALGITDKWVAKDTERVVSEIVEDIKNHKGFQRYLSRLGRPPRLFIGKIKNMTSEAYFPINDLNDELLNELSATGEFLLVDEKAREKILEEITYQNDGMVDPGTAKQVGKQTGADLMIFGNVFMRPHSREGRTIKQYRVNVRMTDIERGLEVMRTREKLNKYSEQDSMGW